jgi:hypothetical protein
MVKLKLIMDKVEEKSNWDLSVLSDSLHFPWKNLAKILGEFERE